MASAQADPPSFLHPSTDGDDPPVTVIREIDVDLPRRPEFERLMGLVIAEATRQPGHLGATVVRPHMARSPYRFIYKFDRRSALERWHLSEVRARLFEPIEPLIREHHTSEYTGLETWFELPGTAQPPKWKVTLVSWLAIYPSVVAGSYAMQWLGWNLSIAAGALVLTAAVVPVVAYGLAPMLGRALHFWLMPNGPGLPSEQRTQNHGQPKST